jgi:hypothetical protein
MDQDRPGWNPPPTGSVPPSDVPLGTASEVASPPRRSRVGTGIAVAAVGIGALGLVGTAYAATGSPSPSPSSGSGSGTATPEGERPALPGSPDSATPGERRGGHHGGGPGIGMGMRGPGMGIHGSFVTPKQGGGYQTIHTQRGVVSAVSSTAITVTSEDGYTKKYVVTADTVVNAQRDGIGSIEVDDEVMVIGVEDGDEVTAVQIMDRTRVKDGMERIAPPGPQPSPSSSTA